MLKSLLLFGFFSLSAVIASSQLPSSYSYGDGPRHQLDVYLPEKAQNAPVIVMLHGGAWQSGDKGGRRIWYPKVSHWGPRGYIFVSVNTRLLPEGDVVDQTRDLGRALTFVQDKLSDWGGDPARLILMGHSSGAHVAALLSTREDLQLEAGVRPWAGSLLLDAAALDVDFMMSGTPANFMKKAFGDDLGFWAEASPKFHLGGGDPDMLAVCSSFEWGTCPDAERFAATGALEGVEIEVLPIPKSHGEVNNHLGWDAAYTARVDAWISERFQ